MPKIVDAKWTQKASGSPQPFLIYAFFGLPTIDAHEVPNLAHDVRCPVGVAHLRATQPGASMLYTSQGRTAKFRVEFGTAKTADAKDSKTVADLAHHV